MDNVLQYVLWGALWTAFGYMLLAVNSRALLAYIAYTGYFKQLRDMKPEELTPYKKYVPTFAQNEERLKKGLSHITGTLIPIGVVALILWVALLGVGIFAETINTSFQWVCSIFLLGALYTSRSYFRSKDAAHLALWGAEMYRAGKMLELERLMKLMDDAVNFAKDNEHISTEALTDIEVVVLNAAKNVLQLSIDDTNDDIVQITKRIDSMKRNFKL